MDKQTFFAKLELAANFCRDFTQSMIFEDLPKSLRFNFYIADWLPVDDKGCVKFIGGRLLKPEELKNVEGKRASQFLWVDGKIPYWINFQVQGFDENYTYIEVSFNPKWLTANHDLLMHKHEGNPPFHILGATNCRIGEKINFWREKK